jgi:hypothetical protein
MCVFFCGRAYNTHDEHGEHHAFVSSNTSAAAAAAAAAAADQSLKWLEEDGCKRPRGLLILLTEKLWSAHLLQRRGAPGVFSPFLSFSFIMLLPIAKAAVKAACD